MGLRCNVIFGKQLRSLLSQHANTVKTQRTPHHTPLSNDETRLSPSTWIPPQYHSITTDTPLASRSSLIHSARAPASTRRSQKYCTSPDKQKHVSSTPPNRHTSAPSKTPLASHYQPHQQQRPYAPAASPNYHPLPCPLSTVRAAPDTPNSHKKPRSLPASFPDYSSSIDQLPLQRVWRCRRDGCLSRRGERRCLRGLLVGLRVMWV